ncbi:hypothetical protein pb186bvf_018711 [Paramecium bursaria]
MQQFRSRKIILKTQRNQTLISQRFNEMSFSTDRRMNTLNSTQRSQSFNRKPKLMQGNQDNSQSTVYHKRFLERLGI